MRTEMLVVLAVACLSGCTWVPLEQSGKTIYVVDSAADVANCREQGEITASVRDRIAFYQRQEAKVADEVETLARNQAADLNADTLLVASELDNGERRYKAYRCR